MPATERQRSPALRIGISSFAFGWAVSHGAPPLTELDVLSFARRHGLGVVQLGDHLPVHAMSLDRCAALRQAAQAAGLEIELGARGLTEHHLHTYLQLCRELGAPLLRFVADHDDYEPSAADLTALLRNATSELSSAGVTLGLENHDRWPAVVLRQIIDAVAHPAVGVCLDTANSLGAGEGLEHVAALLAPVTVNLHVKDVAITRVPSQMGFIVEGRPLGDGQLPLRRTIDLVRAMGRCQSIVLEAWTPPLPEMAETVRREAAWAEESVLTLKRWAQESADSSPTVHRLGLANE